MLGDLIARASHSHPLYNTDKVTVFGAIESATRGSIYSTTIESLARKKDGRGAWKALLIHEWEKIQKDNSTWLKMEWKEILL